MDWACRRVSAACYAGGVLLLGQAPDSGGRSSLLVTARDCTLPPLGVATGNLVSGALREVAAPLDFAIPGAPVVLVVLLLLLLSLCVCCCCTAVIAACLLPLLLLLLLPPRLHVLLHLVENLIRSVLRLSHAHQSPSGGCLTWTARLSRQPHHVHMSCGGRTCRTCTGMLTRPAARRGDCGAAGGAATGSQRP